MGERHLKKIFESQCAVCQFGLIPEVNSRLDITTLSGKALSISPVKVCSAKTGELKSILI